MAKELKYKTSEEIYQEPIPDIIALTIAANRMAGGAQSDTNPYTLRNELIHRAKVKRIC